MTGLVFHLIPHTHWDREWYGPRAHFLARLVPMMDSALDTLKAQPGVAFLLDGQTVALRDYLASVPGARPAVEQLAQDRQLETGPWYILADELIPSGESLIRNLLFGRHDSRLVGGGLDTLYSPDAFGHPAVLPMLAREFGLAGVALWRGYAGARDLFCWQAPDGSRVPVYHLPAGGYEVGMSLPGEQALLAPEWASLRRRLTARAGSRHIAVLVGADHHRLRTDLPALANSIAALEPDAEVRISRLDDFLALAAVDADRSEPVTGELRAGYGHTWSLQGVHGTRLPLKRLNAATELLLERFAEPLSALTAPARPADSAPLLETAWRAVLESQFHDTIAGTVHDDAAADAAARLRDAGLIGRRVRDRALALLADIPDAPVAIDQTAGTLVLWNPRAIQAGGVVVADISRFRRDVIVGPPDGRIARSAPPAPLPQLALADGTTLRMQLLGTRSAVERVEASDRYPDADVVDVSRVALLVPPQPGLSVVTGALSPAPPASPPGQGVECRDRMLRNMHLDVHVHGDGSFDINRQDGVRLARVMSLEFETDRGDCYTAGPRGRARKAVGPVRWRTLAGGPLLGAVEGCWQEQDATIRLLLELRDAEAFLRIRLDIDNAGTNRRIRARIPVRQAPYALAGAAFGFERRRRPTEQHWAGEATVMTAPAQRFVSAAGAEGGAALLAPGHIEYELGADGDLSFTVLRSVGELSLGNLPERPGHAAWPTPVPGAQCLGTSSCSLALMPCAAEQADDPVLLTRVWEEAFLAPLATWYRGRSAGVPSAGRIELTGHGLVVSAIKPACECPGLILRALNLSEQAVEGSWRVAPRPGEAWRVRADETRTAQLSVTDAGIPFRAGPRELVSIQVI